MAKMGKKVTGDDGREYTEILNDDGTVMQYMRTSDGQSFTKLPSSTSKAMFRGSGTKTEVDTSKGTVYNVDYGKQGQAAPEEEEKPKKKKPSTDDAAKALAKEQQ